MMSRIVPAMRRKAFRVAVVRPVSRPLTDKEAERARTLYRRRDSARRRRWTISRLRAFVCPECHPRDLCRALFGFTHGDLPVDPIPLVESPPHDACLLGHHGAAKFCERCRADYWGTACRACLQRKIRRFVVVPA